MSQQMRRILAAVGLAAALLLAVPAPSRAASLREPSFAAGLMERVWSWLWSLAPESSSQNTESGSYADEPATTSSTPATPPPTSTDESGSHIDPDGKP
jgi:hypothetical protein